MVYPVWQHFLILAAAILCGFALAVLFCLQRGLIRLWGFKRMGLTDLLFWLMSVIPCFLLWLKLFGGDFRLLCLLWLAVGFVLGFYSLGRGLYYRLAAKHRVGVLRIKVINFSQKGDKQLLALCGKSLHFFYALYGRIKRRIYSKKD